MATFDLRVPAAQRNPSESTVSYLVSLELKDRSGKTRARHSLLRRFSAFEQLFEQLRSALSNIPDPPRKRSFAGVNFNAELIEERRTELESKLQELVSDIRVLKHPLFVRWIELMRADDILFSLSSARMATAHQMLSHGSFRSMSAELTSVHRSRQQHRSNAMLSLPTTMIPLVTKLCCKLRTAAVLLVL
jgi:hypothetical protein